MAVLHGWPDHFKLETAKLHLNGPARFWLQARIEELAGWEDFKLAFNKTFVGQTSTAEKWRKMQERTQQKSESTTAYFLEKMLLCKELNLSLEDAKEQVLIGLRSRDACISLTAKEHKDEDELLVDLRRLERVSGSRIQRSSADRAQGVTSSSAQLVKPPSSKPWASARQGVQPSSATTTQVDKTSTTPTDRRPGATPPKRDATERTLATVRCYGCGKYGHLAKDCPDKAKPTGNFVVNPNNNDPAKFLKTATINMVQQMTARIDTGSSKCMMGHAAAVKCKLQITCSSKGLYGFRSTNEYAVKSI
uniref:Putative transposon ty3-g gag-pol polyprotein n=1 Tax=Ixodes ricinus TaxID=34613 RepID=A0A6B0V8V3_IXORI